MSLTELVIMPGSDYQAICDAVRGQTGGTELLKSGDIAPIIEGIAPTLEELTVTENGEYTPDEGVDGFSKVAVNVNGSGGGVTVYHFYGGLDDFMYNRESVDLGTVCYKISDDTPSANEMAFAELLYHTGTSTGLSICDDTQAWVRFAAESVEEDGVTIAWTNFRGEAAPVCVSIPAEIATELGISAGLYFVPFNIAYKMNEDNVAFTTEFYLTFGNAVEEL